MHMTAGYIEESTRKVVEQMLSIELGESPNSKHLTKTLIYTKHVQLGAGGSSAGCLNMLLPANCFEISLCLGNHDPPLKLHT